ncbi:dodecin family protein [Desulfosoma caldarium]|uniref:Dodecin n=1 Tax=Desulfosoma caldarium TaxID=610254 RepID=A0A3N1UHF6_9BACT|nr:dodecin family protein [Desulfosoma caldarium]ROQ90684.1 dodecin [Desulfosoma caldarium]
MESVDKIIELVGPSTVSWEDAAKNAVETASKTLRDLHPQKHEGEHLA